MKRALHRELEEELGESLNVAQGEPLIIYQPNNDKSRKHVAICYIIELDLDERIFSPSSSELVSKSARIWSPSDLSGENLEDWSRQILLHVFGVQCIQEQPELFSDSYIG
jgi:ADP-ribose pyrophosphatase YjhB (NUDIX family)